MTDRFYVRGITTLGDWDAASAASGDFRILLLASGYSYDAGHDYVADLDPATNEVTPTGYARQQLTGRVVNLDDANARVRYLVSDVTFGALGSSASASAFASGTQAVVFRQQSGDGDSELVSHHDGFTMAFTGGAVTLHFTDNQIGRIDV